MNRRMKGALLVLLCILLSGMLVGSRTVLAQSWQENTQFDIHVDYGYGNTVLVGKYTPFHVSVRNFGEAFSGTVRLMTSAYEEEGYYTSSSIGLPFASGMMTDTYDNYGSVKQLELQQGEEKTVSFDLPYTTSVPYIKVLLEDSEGVLHGEKVIQLEVQSQSAEILIGVLTEKPEQMDYMEGVHLSEYPGVQTSLVFLDEKSLANTDYGLDALDVLILQDFAGETLSQEQQNAIRRWIQKGGRLVFGADTVEENPEENLEENLKENSEGSGVIETEIYGAGRVLTCQGSLALPADGQVSAGAGLAEQLLTAAYSKDELNSLDSGGVYFSSEDYWNAMSRLQSVDMENLPGMNGYVLALVIYVVLAGPVVYLVLKKLGVRKYLWGCVGILAVVFSALIFVMGSRTRFTAPFVNYIQTLRLSPGYSDETVEFEVRAPYNNAYSIYVDSEYSIMPLSEISYSSETEQQTPDFSREAVRITYGEKENQLTMEGDRAFTEKYFRAEKTGELSEDSQITGTLIYYDGVLEGTVENRTAYDLTETFLFFKNHLVYLGDLPAGASVELSGQTLYSFAPGYGYSLLRSLLGLKEEYVEEVSEEFLDLTWKNGLLQKYVKDGYSLEDETCQLVGFTEDAHMQLLKDTAYRQYGQTIVCSDVELSMEKQSDGRTWGYYPFVTSTAQVVSGNYNAYENVYYSREVILQYRVPENLTDISLSFAEEMFFDTEYYKSFGGSIEIYNYTERSYQRVSLEQELDEEQLDGCISGDGSLLIKYVRRSDLQDKAEKLPILIVKGRSL